MIGTFWNLCRACPSVPVDKLHSEYRSTYRWHEYTGSRQDVVRRPPQNTAIGPSSCEPALHRRRKHPELAYRTHDFLLSLDGGTEHLLEKSVIYDRARSEERWGSSRQKSSPRSKSEGPPTGQQPSYRLLYNKGRGDEVDSHRDRTESEFYNDDKVPADTAKSVNTSKVEGKGKTGGTSEYKLQFAWPPVSTVISSGISNICAPRKSISMNGIKSKGQIEDTVPVHRRNLAAKVANQKDHQIIMNGLPPAMEEPKPMSDANLLPESSLKEFRSEYKKQFQPFYNYYFDENRGVFEKKDMTDEIPTNENLPETQNSNWYKEVVLLRKKANQYRHRGWGTELVPDHIAQLYNDQINVWEQVSRRSSLSALSLATTLITKSPRSTGKDEKEKDPRKSSPSKSLTRQRVPKTDLDGISEKQGKPRPTQGNVKTDNTAPKSNTRLKTKSVASPKTRRAISSTREMKESPRQGIDSRPSPPVTRRPRPRENDEEEFPQAPEEQLVKSPPEPTRVKSPEQIVMRSPEPVNWTVPLDTGKTFTVTQNIRDGIDAREEVMMVDEEIPPIGSTPVGDK